MAGDPEGYDEETSRSIFSAFWFRAVLVVIALGIVAIIAVPYVLDMMSSRQKAVLVPPPPKVTPAPAPAPTPAPPAVPSTPAPSAEAPSTPPPATTAPSKTEPAKPEEAAPPTAKAPEPERSASVSSAKPDGSGKAVAPKSAAKPAVTRSKAAAASGPYWVQVGAYRDAATARHVADKLRAANYTVAESTKPGGAPAASAGQTPAASPGGDRYNVFVSGATPADVNAKVGTKGFNAEAVAGGVAVKPSLSLKEAVDLSRELAGEGMKVQVRRAAGEGSTAAPAPAASRGETWYRVRVGSFPDRAAAVGALKELEGMGYKPFLAVDSGRR